MLLITIYGQTVPETPNLSLIKTSRNRYYCILANDSSNSAIFWDSQNTDNTVSTTIHCNFRDKNKCYLANEGEAWSWTEYYDFSPVLDYRWEGFPVYELSIHGEEIFKTDSKNFQLSFSLKMSEEVHILLCDYYTNYPSGYGNCYWLSFGAYNGNTTYIRKCNYGEIPTKKGGYPTDNNCKLFQDSINHTNILEKDRWEHFTISKQQNIITLWKYNRSQHVLKFEDNQYPRFDVKYVLAKKAKSSDAYLKVHKVQALVTNVETETAKIYFEETPVHTCLVLYVKTCQSCSFILTKGSTLTPIKTEKLDDWQEIYFSLEMSEYFPQPFITLRTTQQNKYRAESPYWYVSDSVRKCESTDIVANRNNYQDDCCSVLKNPDHKICTSINGNPPEDFDCPSNTIGKNCLPCTTVANENICQKSKICELTPSGVQCSCAVGYAGPDCSTTCAAGTYGFGCKQDCGKCRDTCNNIDGSCNCEENFHGNTCREAYLSLVKIAPTVISTGHTNVTLQPNLDYDGQTIPNTYQIQYKEIVNTHWTSNSETWYVASTGPVTIPNLKSNTQYVLRIVLYDKNHYIYTGKFVPQVNFLTTCADTITDEFFTFDVLNTSITWNIDDSKPLFKEICPLSKFKIHLKNTANMTLKDQILTKINTFNNLKPYTEYIVEIKKDDVTVWSRTLMTDEGSPSIVRNIKKVVTETNVMLSWDVPEAENGKIKEYRVQATYIRSRACPTNMVDYSEGVTNSINETRISISSLLPYSVYNAKIWAVTKYEGLSTSTTFNTAEASAAAETEFPDLNINNPKDKFIVHITWPCSKLRGSLQFKMELICLSDWCINKSQSTKVWKIEKDSNLNRQVSYKTIGNTHYILRQYISRNNEISRNQSLITLPSAPGVIRNLTVYSKSSATISLRWLPPYPPTGDLETYLIRTPSYDEIKVESTSYCKLWPEKICATVKVFSNGQYYVAAKNINVTERGEEVNTDYVFLRENKPQPPLNISLEWDDGYTITIRWHHPDITNGNLLQFILFFNNTEITPYKIIDEMPEYERKERVPDNQTTNTLYVSVAAQNSAGESSYLKLSTFTPPKKPKFVWQPLIEQDYVQNTSFSITIPSVSNVEGDRSYMYIVVTDINNEVTRPFTHPMEKKLFKEIDVKTENSWVVAEIKLDSSWEGFMFEVGSGTENKSHTDVNWKIANRKLETGNAYNISIILNNTYREFVRYQVYSLNCTVLASPTEGRGYLFALLLIPIVLCIVCFLYIRRNRDKMNSSIYASLQQLGLSRNTNDVPMSPLISEATATSQRAPPQNPNPSVVIRPRSKVIKPAEVTQEDDRKYSKPVKISDLDKYIKESIENGELEKQHAVFQRGQTKPWTYGTKPENKSKNRYTNLAAYDHTRVKLKILNGDPFSDYINANYIDGYKQQKTYIATQGPKASTVRDFWRMIWQEKVEYIIMIANVIEAGKKKVEKYWPDVNDKREFDGIDVKCYSTDVNANFEVRYFYVNCNNVERKVQQFHFLTWPDHGVPLYAQSLAPFLKKMLTIPQGKAPVVVHCSAGVGRTGSLILCDISLRMAAREGKIDLFYYLYKIREQRVNMVDNIEQYKLVHLALLYCLVAPETGIICDETMEKNIETIISTKIQEEMQYLEDSSWQDEAMRNTSFSTDLPIIHTKNRFKKILPDQSARILLSPYPSTDPTSAYINAVVVDAFLTPSKFIVTQDPLSNTVGDFWRLVEEKQVTMIVCLNQLDFQDKSTCKFYPASSGQTMKPVPYLEIKYTGKEVNAHYKVYNIIMSRIDGQEEDTHIKIMHVNNWTYDMLHPENPIGLLMAYEEMNRLGRTSDKILITCHDGARASGLFVSMCFIIDKIKMEQICDVCLAVRTVRHSRKEFIKEPDQFSFLYRSGLEYVRQFEMYSNFSSNKSSK